MDAVSGLHGLVGEAPLRALVAEFYARVRTDPVLAPLYPEDDWEGAERRLADFLVFRCGGPPVYLERRGHPRLRMRHAPFAIDAAAREAWVAHMGAALDRVALPPAADAVLRRFLGETATFLVNRPAAPSRPSN